MNISDQQSLIHCCVEKVLDPKMLVVLWYAFGISTVSLWTTRKSTDDRPRENGGQCFQDDSPFWVWRQTLDLSNRGWLTANGCVHVRLSWEWERDQCSEERCVLTGWNVETSRSGCIGNAKACAWRSLAWIKSRPWISMSGDSDVLSQTYCRSCDSWPAYITALMASERPPWPIHRRLCILTECFHCSFSKATFSERVKSSITRFRSDQTLWSYSSSSIWQQTLNRCRMSY